VCGSIAIIFDSERCEYDSMLLLKYEQLTINNYTLKINHPNIKEPVNFKPAEWDGNSIIQQGGRSLRRSLGSVT